MTDPVALIEERLHAVGSKVKRYGDKIQAQCPAHPDDSPSLSVAYGTMGRDVLVYCHAHCKPDDVLRALNLEWTDFGDQNPKTQPVATWIYKDADGRPLYRVVKNTGKRFFQEAYNRATGEWGGKLDGIERVPYRLPELLAAINAGTTVYVAEGEKDVDALVANGLTATCNSGGAGKFTSAIARHLRGAKEVVIVADRDDPGVSHARDVAGQLLVQGVPSRIVQAKEGKDAYDHFAFGHDVDDFVPLDHPDNEPTVETWPDPIPLGDGGDRPPFPVHVLGDTIATHARQVADELQMPVDLPAMVSITALSIVLQGRVEVVVQGTWTEQLSTYLVSAMPPSAGKSPAFKAMLAPVEEWELHLVERAAPERDRVETQRKILTKAQNKAIDKGEVAEALAIGDDLRELPEVAVPRLMADDVTPEKIPPMLLEQGGRLALVSTEGGVFSMMTGRYTDKPNLDVYLKAWSGDTIRVDRVGRPDTVVRRPALTVGLTVQPDVIRSLGETPELRGRGLTARFMFSLPPDLVGSRDMRRPSTWDHAIADAYRQLVIDVAMDTPETPVKLRLSDDALDVFLDWRQDHERRLAPSGDLRPMAEWVTKLQSTVARLAAILHVARRRPLTDEIAPDVMRDAITVGNYWEAHARLAHDLWGADTTMVRARAILDWARSGGLERFSMRDAYSAHRRLIPRAADAVDPLNLLMENGWIRGEFDGPLVAGKRGQESPTFTVHPRLATQRRNPDESCVHARHALKGTISLLSSSSVTEEGSEGRSPAHDAHGAHDPDASTDAPEADDASPVDKLPTPDYDPLSILDGI